MRNEDRILTRTESAMVATRTRQLSTLAGTGETVTVEYTKRDGTHSVSTGTVDSVKPNGSKGIVVLDTIATKGRMTSVNLYNVTKVIK